MTRSKKRQPAGSMWRFSTPMSTGSSLPKVLLARGRTGQSLHKAFEAGALEKMLRQAIASCRARELGYPYLKRNGQIPSRPPAFWLACWYIEAFYNPVSCLAFMTSVMHSSSLPWASSPRARSRA